MPKALENKLMKEADKKHMSGDRKKAYVYGTMRKSGWKPKKQTSNPNGKFHKL